MHIPGTSVYYSIRRVAQGNSDNHNASSIPDILRKPVIIVVTRDEIE